MKTNDYLVEHGKKIKLKDFKTKAPKNLDKNEVKEKLTPANLAKMVELQDKLYAENKQGLIVVFQAMDAAGKDGAIKHVMTALNPQGVTVTPFKAPTSYELDHDYLWRIHKAIPARGEIGILNRSHYEEVIITRVHDLLQNQQIPLDLIGEDVWDKRYKQIRNYEEYYYENGFRFVKFFLHLSKNEQKQRLLDRINEPSKNWKFSQADIKERKYWDKYQNAYEMMLNNTSTEKSPWYVIPADNKWFSRYLISQIVAEQLESMNPKYPELPDVEKSMLSEWKRILEEEE